MNILQKVVILICLSTSLTSLSTREQLVVEKKALEKKIDELKTKIKSSCSSHRRTSEISNLENMRSEFRSRLINIERRLTELEKQKRTVY